MSNPVILSVTWFKNGNTVKVLGDGFGVQTRHDACLEVIEGQVQATKFGINQTGPSAKEYITQMTERAKEFYEKQETELHVYTAKGKHYIPSTIERVFTDDDNYAMFDTQTEIIYQPSYDSRESLYNLIAVGEKSIRKIEKEELEKQLGSQYKPLVRVE